MIVYFSDSFCVDCVKERCRSLQFESHLAEDQKYFVKALKLPCERYVLHVLFQKLRDKFIRALLFRTGFWVSKKSLPKWKVLAQKVQEQVSPSGNLSSFDESASPDQVKPTRTDDSPEVVDMDTECKRGMSGSEGGSVGIDDKDQVKFNEDLLCEHGKYFT